MEKKKVLFQIKCIKGNNWNFTTGQVYDVIGVDKDGDYILIDNFYDKILHYKKHFVPLDQIRKQHL